MDLPRPLLTYIPARDPRNWPATEVIAAAKEAASGPAVLWPLQGIALDQGRTPQCTAYSATHWLHCAPAPILKHPAPEEIYREAQKRDQWPGEHYEGSSVLGACKALKYFGLITAYHFCRSIDEVRDALLYVGPVMVGVPWYEEMFTPDRLGQVHPGGTLAGGHAFTLHAYRSDSNLVRAVQSWGLFWGKWGARFTLSLEDLDTLIFRQFGEAATATKAV